MGFTLALVLLSKPFHTSTNLSLFLNGENCTENIDGSKVDCLKCSILMLLCILNYKPLFSYRDRHSSTAFSYDFIR